MAQPGQSSWFPSCAIFPPSTGRIAFPAAHAALGSKSQCPGPSKSYVFLLISIKPLVAIIISSYRPMNISNFFDSGATTPLTPLASQTAASNNNNNPHSTTSPNSSPANVSLTNSSQLTPPHTDENDNNLNDDRFENDNISVTGSPTHANSTEDDERRSPSPFQSAAVPPQTEAPGNGGAFTSLIQRNTKKSDFLSNLQMHQRPTAAHPLHQQLPQQNQALNHALAAQLFLQSPLMPQPGQWLYSQLYGNYNELPWLRSSLQSSNGFRLTAGADAISAQSDPNESSATKRSITLISHLDDEKEASASPPVTSTKRTPSPHDDIEIVSNTSPVKPKSDSLKCRTPKHVDVWRPY